MKAFVRTVITAVYGLLFVLGFVPVITVGDKGYSLFRFFIGTPLRDTVGSMGVVVTQTNVISIQAIAIFTVLLIIAVLVMTLHPKYDGVSIFIKIVVGVSLFFYSAWLGIVKFALTGCGFTFFALLAVILYIAATFTVVFGSPEAEDNRF